MRAEKTKNKGAGRIIFTILLIGIIIVGIVSSMDDAPPTKPVVKIIEHPALQ